jgi:hypothetical protein
VQGKARDHGEISDRRCENRKCNKLLVQKHRVYATYSAWEPLFMFYRRRFCDKICESERRKDTALPKMPRKPAKAVVRLKRKTHPIVSSKCCENPNCNKPLVQKKRPGGQWESLKSLAQRRFCDRICSGVVRLKESRPFPVQYCAYEPCGKQLVLRIGRHRRFESLTSFKTRKYCNRKCAGAALYDSIKFPRVYCQLPTCGKEIPVYFYASGRRGSSCIHRKKKYCSYVCASKHRWILRKHREK